MIKKLQIQNIQSHKKTILNFCSGVNVIVGKSNCGKSAVLRSLYFLIENKISPDSINNNKNKNYKKEMFAELEIDGKKIKRFKTKKDNGYCLGEEVYTAIGKNIPDTILNALNFSDVNIQKQMDGPFLLSSSAGDVAKYLNKIIKLDIIDAYVGSVSTEVKRVNRKEKEIFENVKETKKHLDVYKKHLAELEPLIQEYKQTQENKNREKEQLETISNLVSSFHRIKEVKNISTLQKHVKEIEKIEQDKNDIDTQIQKVKKWIGKYHKYIVKDIKNIKRLLKKVFNKKQEIGLYARAISLYKQYGNKTKEQERIKNKKEELEKLLPEICPLCGGSMDA